MKKFTPILILILIIGVVSVSGCISIIDSDNTTSITDDLLANASNSQTNDNTTNMEVSSLNKSGNIIIGTEKESDKIKKELKDNDDDESKESPKISKDEIEKEVIRIMKLNDNYLNYTADATLTYDDDGAPYYIVDVYDDYGWYAFFKIDANKGPVGNDQDGYGVDGGAFRGETGDEPNPIQGVMPKLSYNDAREIMDKELENSYSIDNAMYTISGFLENGTPYYNLSIEEIEDDDFSTIPIGTAIMDANTGEIISISLHKESGEKIYSSDEAGDYVDIIYKGKEVSVRQNYPYYSPQTDKIYHSQEEEAEDLIALYDDFN